jgi:glycerophosphoryl diester phosphodiesterase
VPRGRGGPDLIRAAAAALLTFAAVAAAAFDIQGHRGARGLRPENTIVSI